MKKENLIKKISEIELKKNEQLGIFAGSNDSEDSDKGDKSPCEGAERGCFPADFASMWFATGVMLGNKM